MSPFESPLFVKSVEKAFAVLKVFSRDMQSLGLGEIAERAELDKSAAQRFVHTLLALGYLQRDSRTRSYRLSPRLLEFGFTYLDMDPLIAATQEPLRQLHESTGEAITLARLDDKDIILVARWPSKKIITVNVRVGSRLPALYMASGRVLVAAMPDLEQERILGEADIRAHTPLSISKREDMRRALRKVREQGYCVTRSQYFMGDFSIAAPIVDTNGETVASVSVNVVDVGVVDSNREKQLRRAVVASATASTRALGVAGYRALA